MKNDRILSGLLAVGFLVLYIATLCPGVYLGDSGELIAAGVLLDVAHPPGYPLYCLGTRIFAALGSGSPAARVNALSAVAAALSVGLFFRIARIRASVFASLLGSLLFGISSLLWSHAAVAEVYAPHLLVFLAALFYIGRGSSPRDLALAAWFGGLSLAAHPLGLGFLPLLALAIAAGPREGRTWRAILRSVLLYAAPLTLFLYLPVRSALDPPMDWGNPETFRAFAAHVLRLQYRDVPRPDASLSLFLRELLVWARGMIHGNLPAPLLPLLFLGVLGAFVRNARRHIIFLSGLLLFGPVLIAYLRFPLATERVEENLVFFLPALSLLVLFLTFGTDDLIGALPRGRVLRFALQAALLLVVAMRFGPAWKTHRFDAVVLPERYARDVIGSVPRGGTLVAEGDDILFPLLYLQHVEGLRCDVSIRDAEGTVFPPAPLPDPVNRYFTFPAPGLVPAGLLFIERGAGPVPMPEGVPLSSGEAALSGESTPLRSLWVNYTETRARSEPEIERAVLFRRAALELSGEPLPRGEGRAARYAEATVLVERGREGEAAVLLRAIVSETPGEALPRLLLAEIALRQGEKDEALRLASLETFPSASTLVRGATIFLYAGDRARAESMLEEAARRDPSAAEPLVVLQRLAEADKKWEVSARLGRQAIAVDPALAEVRLRLARAYRATGDAGRAAREYAALIRLDPGHDGAVEARAFLGRRGGPPD